MDAQVVMAIGTVCLCVGPAIAALLKLVWRVAKLELKVDTMWSFQMKRAVSETISSGVATMNSPLCFTDTAMAYLDPIKDDLVKMWKKRDNKHSDADMLLEIERRFGDELLTSVCIPRGVSHGACLLLALAIAKGGDSIELTLPKTLHRETAA